MGISATMLREEPLERRRAERWRVRLGALRLDSGPDAQPLSIRDLSSSGFLFETEQPLKAGACLIIEMPGGINKICKTVWNSGRFHGATFSEPLSDTELDDLVSLSNVVRLASGERRSAKSGQATTEPASEQWHEVLDESDVKLPVPARILVIVAVSAALWALIGLAVWFAVT